MRGLLREWLTGAGFAVREGSLRQAKGRHTVDLLIIDVSMPRESGAQIIRGVQRAYPGTPIIAISGRFHAGLRHSSSAARAMGAQRLLPKPFSRDDLLSAVREVLGSQ
jgi:DNA-binding response OmpR family regulator